MKAISFTFNNFDFVVGTFKLTSSDRIISMIKNAILKKSQAFDKRINRWMVNMAGHLAPVIQRLFNLLSIAVVEKKFKMIFQHIQDIEPGVQFKHLLQMALLIFSKIILILKQNISAALENFFILLVGLYWL